MATPLDERTIGNAPYDESAVIEAARHTGNANRSLRAILMRAFAGMGSFRQQDPLGANVLNVLGGVGRASMAEKQQASLDEYRAQQQAMEERRQARLEQEKPPKPAKEPKPTVADKISEIEGALGRPLSPEERAKVAGVYIPQKAPAKGRPAPRASAADNARQKKLQKELAALQYATESELQVIPTDATLEPETQRAALQMLRRRQSASSPSQVGP